MKVLKHIALLFFVLAFGISLSATAMAVPDENEVGETDSDAVGNGVERTARQQGEGDIEDPDKYWAMYGYPDYISYAFYAGGETREDEDGNEEIYSYWEIGIVNGGEDEKREILDMLSPCCLVTFFDCEYSYSQRKAVYDEIRAAADPNIKSVYMIQNTQEVLVIVENGKETDYGELLENKYGGVVIVANEDFIGDDLTDYDRGGSEISWYWLLIFALAVLCLGYILVNAIHIRRVKARRIAGGSIDTEGRLSRRDIENAVKDSGVSPPCDMPEKILEEIERRKN